MVVVGGKVWPLTFLLANTRPCAHITAYQYIAADFGGKIEIEIVLRI